MSEFNISDFKSQIRKGGARPNLFKVVCPKLGPDSEKFTFTCRAASIPAMTVGNIDVSYQGRKIKVAGDRTFAEWQVTVYNDEDWGVRYQFEQWNNKINLHEENVRDNPYNITGGLGDSYKQDMIVSQYDKSGNVLARYTLKGAYPSEVAAMDLAWDTNDTIQEFTVTFQYDYFISEQLSSVI